MKFNIKKLAYILNDFTNVFLNKERDEAADKNKKLKNILILVLILFLISLILNIYLYAK